MIYYRETFQTRPEAEAWIAAVKRNYHPCGYGTTLDLHELDDGTFLVTGFRYSSCD